MNKEVVISVKDLRVSFVTDRGTVQAVRGVSFDLYRGETLCIVGESGSGKSVTNKAIMGILPGNARIKSGQIIYEGEDLTKISEEDFHRIRGNKIGMIFQDPLSSLNPIMKIGKQITEAMLVNNNRLKRYYDELIAPELIAYKNKITERITLTNNFNHDFKVNKNKLEEDIYKVKDNKELSREEKSAAIKKLNDEYNSWVSNSKVELKEKGKLIAEELIPLKKALNVKKKEAKRKLSEHKKELKNEYIKEVETLKSSYSGSELKEKLHKAKSNYISKIKITRHEAKQKALEVMREVGIKDAEKRFKQYPFEFSGGMRQRIVIAIALTANPEVLICDEPTTALDVTIQAQILELINKLKRERNLSCIFITHDLGVVANMADRVAVMYAGKIVEYGTAKEIFFEPKHPYLWALLSSIPDIDSKEKLEAIPGTPPDMIYPPKGDAFALRSKYALGIDFKEEPPYFKISDTHYAATWLLDERAPKVDMPKIVKTRIKNSLKEEGETDEKRS